MKKQKKNYMERLYANIGKTIVRTRPTVTGSRSFMDLPVRLIGITNDGCLQIEYYGEKLTLRKSFTDSSWRPSRYLSSGKPSKLNKYAGKMVIRNVPVICPNGRYDYSYTDIPHKLVHATRHHVVLYYPLLEKNIILPREFAKPSDWSLVPK